MSLLRMSDISKSFPGVQALAGIDFEIEAGEVHALVGENGAGKSTLMHILAGVHRPDRGSIALDGRTVTIPDERQAQRLGIAIVYQERSLFGLLSVAENLFVDSQPVNRFGMIDRRALRTAASRLMRRVGMDVDPDRPAGVLPPAQQQMVEIAKALSFQARVMILDEPTAALNVTESEILFGVIRQLKTEGTGVIYISHRLEEIFRIGDRVTVLRDGRLQGTLPVAQTSPEDLVSRMVGRAISLPSGTRPAVEPAAAPALEIRRLSGPGLHDISLSVRHGEVVALAGLSGAGRSELAQAIFGARTIRSGEIVLDGRLSPIRSPGEAIAAGIGYLPEDRQKMGLFPDMNLAANVAAATLERFGTWWWNERECLALSHRYMVRLRIAAPGPDTAARTLSGGNQQKVMLARWLLRNPTVLIIDEPTQGIDVGAKAEVYGQIRELAAQGKAILVISSELPEVLALADRILVMRSGRITAELPRAGATEEQILRHAGLSSESSAKEHGSWC